MSEEKNFAEIEAEKILQAEFNKARAEGETCPRGDQCPVHFRVDEEYFDEEEKYARIITYIGEYVVVTDDSHELENPALLLGFILGVGKKIDVYETSIYKVGDGTIGDLSEADAATRLDSIRYMSTHNDWSLVGDQHKAAVIGLTSGLIDVSKPIEMED